MFVFFRFDVEICDSTQATREEMLKKVPGTFGIFCWASTKIDEEVIKAAGEYRGTLGSLVCGQTTF